MPSLIIIKLVPSQATLPDTFRASLNGLTINAYVLTLQDSSIGVKIGSANGVAAINTPLELAAEIDPLLDNSIQALESSIIQDYTIVMKEEVSGVPLPIPVPKSVATAVIIVKPLATSNLDTSLLNVRLEFKRGSLNLPDPTVDYNIQVTRHDLITDQLAYINMQASTYFSLPIQILGLPSNSPFIALDPNGKPPDFTQLSASIDIILARPHPTAQLPQKSLLEVRENPLTAAQSLIIASEITWNRTLYPVPIPPTDIHQLYTLQLDDKKQVIPATSDNENDRKQFESDIQNYHLTHDTEAARLSGFVFAASAAIACERLSNQATLVGITFPVETVNSSSTNYSAASVVLKRTESSGQLLNFSPEFTVPAAFFYALGTSYPSQVSVQQRYNAALLATEDQLRSQFQTAVDSGLLVLPAGAVGAGDSPEQINYDQAARRLTALGGTNIGPQCDSSQILPANPELAIASPSIIEDWLQYNGLTTDISTSFWAVKISQYPSAYVALLLQAITSGETGVTGLVSQIQSQLKIGTVQQLIALKESDWRNFFTASAMNTQLLPEFTMPGTVEQRVDTFVQRLQKFFIVQPDAVNFKAQSTGQAATLPIATNDILQQFFDEYNIETSSSFNFTNPLDFNQIDAALLSVFPDNTESRSWLKIAIERIHTLVQITSSCPSNMQFSLMEALYSRGFTSFDSIKGVTQSEFKSALAGSVAYAYAETIFLAYAAVFPNTTPVTANLPSKFSPVSDGSLLDLTPEPNQSPFSTIAYLHELLTLPFSESTLGTLLAARRGPLGKLQSSLANTSFQLPYIDLVNESLEALGDAPDQGHGVVMDTLPSTSADFQDHLIAIPEHSSPSKSSDIYNTLKSCFTTSDLPYSQSLDVNRSISASIGTTRFDEMRHFRKDITELSIDGRLEPDSFQRQIWRYPVRFAIALEYLHISPEEYSQLFSGTQNDEDFLKTVLQIDTTAWKVSGLSVSSFLGMTGLNYSEFLGLWRCKYVPFESSSGINASQASNGFPDGEPPNSNEIKLVFDCSPDEIYFEARKLFVFVRLWRLLHFIKGPKLSFDILSFICKILDLFIGKSINDQFIRQLSALIMIRNDFQLCNTGSSTLSSEDGIDLLIALWRGPKDNSSVWNIAVSQILKDVERYAKNRYCCQTRKPSFLSDSLHSLSVLAGFSKVDPWYANPTSTIRFFEVLSKAYASDFAIGEISLIFTANEQKLWDDPFTLQSEPEATLDPLRLSEDKFNLWQLRHKLLRVHTSDEEARKWEWPRIRSSLLELGYTASEKGGVLTTLREYFFPNILDSGGKLGEPKACFFEVDLAAASTTPTMWSSEPCDPFHYDSGSGKLSFKLPLEEKSVIKKLKSVRQLSEIEAAAIQGLYFAPRAVLAPFAAIFSNFQAAVDILIHEPSEEERFRYFQQQFAIFYRRCEVIADHLTKHVVSYTGNEAICDRSVTRLVLSTLIADGNSPIQGLWESDSGVAPSIYTWDKFSGGAFASLLGLIGTGLSGDFQSSDKSTLWRQVTGDLKFFGYHENRDNAPVPTVIPSLQIDLVPEAQEISEVINGFAIRQSNGESLGGAQSFGATWSGALLVDHSGEYLFFGGHAPTSGESPISEENNNHYRWLVTLRRGPKNWILLNHRWQANPAPPNFSEPVQLQRGAYDIEIKFEQCHPSLEEHQHKKLGFQIKYQGPDTEGSVCIIPFTHLFHTSSFQSLEEGLNRLSHNAKESLSRQYNSSFRDIRRTYQRAFKSLLLISRFQLCAKLDGRHSGESELKYFLNHPENFLGTSYYRDANVESKFKTHRAYLDLNFIPVQDSYWRDATSADSRNNPSAQRKAAMFDWWERIFDYCELRKWVHSIRNRQAWMLFHEATDQAPHTGQLIGYLISDISFAPLVQKFLDTSSKCFELTTSDLVSEPWAIRSWQAGLWFHSLKTKFHSKLFEKTQPWLWSADSPNIVNGTESGNQNLTRFFNDSLLELGASSGYEAIKELNDGLRSRARTALLSYLCDKNRVALPFRSNSFAQTPMDLTELLLLDVESGIRQRATRIDEALCSVHLLVQRARLGLEPSMSLTPEFIHLWDTHYESFEVWEAKKRRQLYPENWVHWNELHKARKSEGFRLLEQELRRNVLTVTKPGGQINWSSINQPNSNLLDFQRLAIPIVDSSPANPGGNGLNLLVLPNYGSHQSLVSGLPSDKTVANGDSPNSRIVSTPTSSNIPEEISELSQHQTPLWIKAAIKIGVKFVRVAAAGNPPLVPRSLFYNNDPSFLDLDHKEPLTIDEYYFWIVPGNFYDGKDVDQNADLGSSPPGPSSAWDADQTESIPGVPDLNTLLIWNTESIAHLNWCRVHYGRFETPRRSYEGFSHGLTNGNAPDLTFTGRIADSLTFSVNGTDAFRYDMPADTVAIIKTSKNPVIDTTSFPNPLKAHPFFIYFDPGAPLIPLSNFSTAVTIAGNLRSHNNYEAAVRWYESIYKPLEFDNSWTGNTPSTRKQKNQAVILEYLETLLQWGKDLRNETSLVRAQQASMLFNTIDKILGPKPKQSRQSLHLTTTTVEDFVPSEPPLNPRLLSLYDRLADYRSQAGSDHIDSYPTFGNELGYQAKTSSNRRHPYRFAVLLPKAVELVGYVRSLGNSLLQALERGDGEYLASIQSTHEQQIINMSIDMKKNQFRNADWEVQGLQKALVGAMCRLTYNQNLIRNGLNSNEIGYQTATDVALATKAAASVSLGIAEAMTAVPDGFAGDGGVAASPLIFSRLTGGSSLSQEFTIAATIISGASEISNNTGQLFLTQSTWDRRMAEWSQEVDVITIEIQQVERQKLAADRQKAIFLRDLNICQRQVEHSAEVQDFMREKVTNLDLYMFLQQETAILYRQAYDLALQASREAQDMFQYELRDTPREFLPSSAWSNLREGLLAGERLELALHTMERAYMEANCREHEITKQLSLSMNFPAAFLLLKTTGRCEINIPEWMFDLEYPGQYMRRLRSVGLTIPCVIGPYGGVHCRLELLSSTIRVNSQLADIPLRSGQDNGYEIQGPTDPRFVKEFGVGESIATSNGQGDGGLFELNFHDERYLPFEYSGAISRWRIELPQDNNQFDLDTLTDVVMTLNYTARNGGQRLRHAANECAQRKLPGAGWRFFDVRYEFPDTWNIFQQSILGVHQKTYHGKHHAKAHSGPELHLMFNRNMFPFLTGRREINIVKIQLLVQAPEDAAIGEYIQVQYHKNIRDQRKALDNYQDDHCQDRINHIEKFDCVLAAEYPGFYHGVLNLGFRVPRAQTRGRDDSFGYFSFPEQLNEICELREAYLLVQYEYCHAKKGRSVVESSTGSLKAPVNPFADVGTV